MAAMVEAAVATDAAMIRSRVIHAKWADRWRWVVLQRMMSTSGFIPAASHAQHEMRGAGQIVSGCVNVYQNGQFENAAFFRHATCCALTV